MFNKQSYRKNGYMLNGSFKKKGYDWWWHSFTAYNKKTGEPKSFYIEYFIINPKLYPHEVVLGQDPQNKKEGKRPSYLMVNVGTWGESHKQLHRFFKMDDVNIKVCPFEVKADNCFLNETETYGEVNVKKSTKAMMCDEGSMKWNLKIKKEIAWNVGYGTSGLFRFLKAFEMYWHAQGMKSTFEGSITLDGEEYDVIPEKSYGYSDKNWGRDFTSPWVWLSSNHIIRKDTGEELHNSVFDIGGGKPKVFGISLERKLLAGYFIEGKEYEMNFSKITHPCKTTFDFKDGKENVHWTVIQEDKKYKIVTEIECARKEMLFINYEEPTGNKRHNNLFNCGNGKGTLKIYKKEKNKKETLIEDLIVLNVGCEYGEFTK